MIGFMQFQMVFALISKNKIERHPNEGGSATCLVRSSCFPVYNHGSCEGATSASVNLHT